MRMEMKTSKGYLIYLDVLGYRNILSSGDKNEIDNLRSFISKLDEKAIAIKAGLFLGRNNIVLRSYSDNFLILYKAKVPLRDDLAGVISFASNIIGNAISYGFMMRGSIVYGELTYNNQSIFGRDIITAYELEAGHNEPCIVLDPSLKIMYEENNLFEDDLLSPFSTFHKNDKTSAEIYARGIGAMVKRLNFQSFVDGKTLEKYKWLINEYNRYFEGTYHIEFKVQPSHYEIEIGNVSYWK